MELSDAASSRWKPGQFPPVIAVPPVSLTHKLTVIFLHGRGSNAQKFHVPFLDATVPGTELPLRKVLQDARFVFPTAPRMRAAKYKGSLIHQWYEGTGDWEPEARGEMRPSVEHIHGILESEIRLLGGDASRIALAGISQGCAMALVSLLLWDGDALGAAVGMCGFMPLASHLLYVLGAESPSGGEEGLGSSEIIFDDDVFEADDAEALSRSPLQRAIDDLREEVELDPQPSQEHPSFLSTPVYLGHGVDDEMVLLQHGEQAAKVLETMGMDVDFHNYADLGHWYSPRMLSDMVLFLKRSLKI